VPDESEDEMSSNHYYELLRVFDQFLHRSMGIIQKMFTKHTGFHCHVSIKTYHKQTGQLRHVVRDHMASEKDERHAIDEHRPGFNYQEKHGIQNNIGKWKDKLIYKQPLVF